MTVKEFLQQAHRIDMRINSKLEQIESLNELAAKCTSVMTGMPHSSSGSTSLMADAVAKIVDLQNEVRNDMLLLVETKKRIVCAIKTVDSPEGQVILEKRYISGLSWEQIAVDLSYSIQHVFRLHDRAIEKIVLPEEDESKCDSL